MALYSESFVTDHRNKHRGPPKRNLFLKVFFDAIKILKVMIFFLSDKSQCAVKS